MGLATTGAILVCQVGYMLGAQVEAPVEDKWIPPPVSFPNILYSFNNFPSPSMKSPGAHF